MGLLSTIKGWWNRLFKSEMKKEFGVTGITSGTMQSAIETWMQIYSGNPEWIDAEEEIKTIKFAKLICEETARLATLAVHVKFDGKRNEYMQKFWENSVKPNLRTWVEYGCAMGTIILKPNGKGIDFVTPDRFEITGKDANGNISGIVFQDSYQSGENYYTKHEYHRFMSAEVKMPGSDTYTNTMYYTVSNRAYVSKNIGELGTPVDLASTKWSNLKPDVQIVKKNGEQINSMLFGIFKMPAANDIDLNSPLGLSIFSNAIEELKDLDIAYSRYAEEIKDSRKMVLLDERLSQLPAELDKKGNRIRRHINLPKYVKNVMAESPEHFYQEVNPQLNTDVRVQGINNQLSMIGFKCGYSNGYFVLDEKTGMITATQVESDDRRTIQLIKDVRDALQICLDALFYAQSVFADLYNMVPAGDYKTSYDFGDITYNYEEDKARWWGYVQAGKIAFWRYLVKFEKFTEEDAKMVEAEMKEKEKEEKGLFDEE